MKTIITLLFTGMLFLSACKTSDITEPEYRDVQDIQLKDVGLLHTTASVDLMYYNPNNFGVNLSAARGDVYLDNKYLGRFEMANKVSVRKNAGFIMPVLLKIDNIGSFKNQRDIYKKKEILLHIEGMVKAGKGGFSKEFPVKYEKMENMDKLRSIFSL